MDLRVVDGDLLDQEVEVIVNAWNRNILVEGPTERSFQARRRAFGHTGLPWWAYPRLDFFQALLDR